MTDFSRRTLLKTAAAGAALGLAPAYLRHASAAEPIQVAGIHDASGGIDIYGRPMINSLALAVEEINAAGGVLGRPIALKNYDPQSNMQLYTQYATEAATKQKASVVFGGIISASREAMRPTLRRFRTPYFYNMLYEGGVCDRNVFCMGSTPAQTLQKFTPFVMKRFNAKTIYVLAADYNYGQITTKWIRKFASENGGAVAQADFFPLDVNDFGPTIRKIQAEKPDMIMSVLVGAAHNSFYRQWVAAGMKDKIPMASTTFGIGNEQVLTSPDEHNGIVVSYAYFDGLKTPENEAFLKKYTARFGEKADAVTEASAMTYHAVNLWAAAAAKAGSVDRDKVILALESGLSFTGPAGKTTIDPKTHHDTLDTYIAEVRDRAYHVLESFPQQPPADTAAVCDLAASPNETKQFVIDVKS
ncbi:branched-chain amino acid transport system substrate-binding protein [Methylopila capsulata]|uniref:Branched-chain amino acid transport system substrate-binding protein n=1 Tax=Methylopila capsulata TaxID=61654 RepID=A0A9W6MS49_9HYPH|nr:ABC transporter substrate-binding protein [Methylopila capsulata]MBM7850368.1 branched-chain amino acid transport system substrate-binding protein [Methylopila capsulata]GLK55661.1 urea ABC transporter substrate-binding protein [Methylopila capsulata]